MVDLKRIEEMKNIAMKQCRDRLERSGGKLKVYDEKTITSGLRRKHDL